MVVVFHASDATEAHIVKGMLEANGISAQVNGDLLQGAMGELPAFGLITVSVSESDQEQASQLVEDYSRQ